MRERDLRDLTFSHGSLTIGYLSQLSGTGVGAGIRCEQYPTLLESRLTCFLCFNSSLVMLCQCGDLTQLLEPKVSFSKPNQTATSGS